MHQLSICLIVKNEENHLAELLPLLKQWHQKGAEVIFTDTGSSDRTCKMIAEFGFKLIHFEWCNDFAKARNFGISQARNPWVLWLDADDLPSEELMLGVSECLKKPELCAYTFVIESPLEGEEGQSFRQIRLFPNHKNIQFQGRIHEELRRSCLQNQIEIVDAPISIIHNGYFSESERRRKTERNLSILLLEYAENPNDLSNLIALGHSYYQKKDYQEAFEYYSQALELKEFETSEEYRNLSLFIGNTLAQLGLGPAACEWFEKSMILQPDLWSAPYQLGKMALQAGQMSRAKHYFEWICSQEYRVGLTAESKNSILINSFSYRGLIAFAEKNWESCIEFLLQSLDKSELFMQKEAFDLWVVAEAYFYNNQQDACNEWIQLQKLVAQTDEQKMIVSQCESQKKLNQAKTQDQYMSTVAPKDLDKLFGTIKAPLKPKGKPNTLSVCMIVKNEAKNIEEAIKSIIPFADEIIVNDTGSTDGTLEILKRLPVKVIQNKWEGDFSKARNQAINAATCAWIIWFDADDRVPADQVDDFIKLKSAPLDRSFGFQVINTQAGLPIGARFTQTRMFPNHPQIRFERKIHEQIMFSCAKLGLHCFYLETTIWHTGYESDALKKSKALRNIELLSQETDVAIDPILPMQIGDGYAILEDWEKAIVAYKQGIEVPHCKEINEHVWADLPNCVGRCYQKLHKFEEANEWFKIALERSPERAETMFYMAEVAMSQNQVQIAEPLFYRALAAPMLKTGLANQYDVVMMYSYHNLCLIKLAQKDYAASETLARQFCEKYPQVVEAHIDHGKSLLGLNRFVEASQALEIAIAKNPKADETAWFALETALEKSNHFEQLKLTKIRYKREFLGLTESQSEHGRPLISLCMIVKNESHHLGKCLASAQGLWDELIIVDTGSVDGTQEIAKSYGAKVIEWEWQDDFALARNKSLENATGEWIFWLDADDILLAEDRERIRALVKSSGPCGYGFLIKNSQDFGRTGTVFNQIRLFPNRPQIRFEGRVHEQILGSLTQNGIGVEFKNIRIIHTGYASPEIEKSKQERNLNILLNEVKDPQRITSIKYYSIGGAYMDLGQFDEAHVWFQKALDRSIQIGEDPHVREIAPVRIGDCLIFLGRNDEAKNLSESLILQSPLNPEVIRFHASVLDLFNIKDQAAAYFGQLLWFEEGNTLIPIDYQDIKVRAAKFLGDYWNALGKQSLAVDILKFGVGVGRGEGFSGLQLSEIYFEHEEWDACIELLLFGLKLSPTSLIYYDLGRSYILKNDGLNALKILEEAVQKFPTDAEIRHLYMALKDDVR